MTAGPLASHYRLEEHRGVHRIVCRDWQPTWPCEEQGLARTLDPAARGVVRRMRAIVADESPPRPGAALPGGLRLAPSPWRLLRYWFTGRDWYFKTAPEGVPLVSEDSPDDSVVVGVLEDLEHRRPGATPGAVGHHLVGVFVFSDSLLASIVWRAIADGILVGVCSVFRDYPESYEALQAGAKLTGGTLVRVRLEGVGTHCLLPTTKILETWTEPA